MIQDTPFHFARLVGADREPPFELHERLRRDAFPRLAAAGGEPWGTWHGVFGVATNELFVVTSWPAAADPQLEFGRALDGDAAIEVAEQHVLVPTVRPTDRSPVTREGLYVFRFFDVLNVDVEEFAELSASAWTTWETSADWQSEPRGLFCLRDRGPERGIMLLCTWYEGLASWQASRRFPPEARENFQRRQQLTLRSIAFATRLVHPGGAGAR